MGLIDAELDIAAFGNNRYVVVSKLIAKPASVAKQLCALLFYFPNGQIILRQTFGRKQR